MAAEKEAKKAGAGAGGNKGKTGSMTLATLPALKGGVPPLVVA